MSLRVAQFDLFLLIVLGAALFAFLIEIRRSGFSPSALSRVLFFLLFCTPLALIVSGGYLESREQEESVLALLDVSASVDPKAAEEMLDRLREFERFGTPIEVLPFAGSVSQFPFRLSEVSDYSRFRDSLGSLNTASTNFSALLSDALQDRDGKVLLLSDGFESSGSGSKIPENPAISPILPSERYLSRSEFRVRQIYNPLRVPAETSVEVRTVVENSSGEEQTGTLKIFQNEKLLREERVRIPARAERIIRVDSDKLARGISELRAELTPSDTRFGESLSRGFLSTEKREKVLLVSGSAQDARFLEKVLTEQEYTVEELRVRDRRLRIDVDDASTIIFNNVPLNALEPGTDRRLKEFVRKGGGFLMLGGNTSFGLGGYIDSQVEEILPIRMVPPKTEKKRLNVAVQLVLDKSRSMSFDSKIEFAKEASREVIRNLKNDDYIGIIGFDAQPFIVVRIGQLSQIREMAMSRVMRLYPAKSTNLFPALQEATRGLRRTKAGRKHMIVLTDGKLPDASPAYLELTRSIRAEGVSISTVLIGSQGDDFYLKEIARLGGGSFYQTADARALPRIFVKDIEVNTGEKSLKEDREYPVRKGPDGITSVQARSFPALEGFVETKPRDKAKLELLLLSSSRAHPLLASWDYGEGRVVAFTSDANGRWSRKWVDWKSFYPFWRDIVDSLRPEDQSSGPVDFDLSTRMVGESLELELVVFEDLDFSLLRTELTSPDGTVKPLSFEQQAPGRFTTRVASARAGIFSLTGDIGDRKLTEVKFAVSGESLGERSGQGFNLDFLEQVAAKSGGELNPADDYLAGKKGFKVTRTRPYASLFLLSLLFLSLYIISRELIVRRVVRAPAGAT